MQNLLNATGRFAKFGFTDKSARTRGSYTPNVTMRKNAYGGIVTQGRNPLDWYDEQFVAALQKELRIVDGQLVEIDVTEALAKTDLTTTTTGVRNVLYGREVFLQYSQQLNSWGVLPKTGWPENGWGFRASTAAALSSAAGIAQGAAVGTAVVPTFLAVDVTPKEVEIVTGETARLAATHAQDDTITFEENLNVVQSNFLDTLDTDIHVNTDTLASNNLESLDRVSSSSVEATDLSFTAADEDIYGVDRSGNTSFDANALYGTAGADRALTITLINQLRQAQEQYWARFPENKVFLTGYDTHRVWSEQDGTRQRFAPQSVTVTINGIQSSPGTEGGFKLSSWEGVPVVRDANVVVDTISRIQLLDLDFGGVAVGRPLEYVESDNPYEVGHNKRGLLYMIGELYFVRFKPQGHLRDLKE